jgi:hypothetical protein
MTKSSSVQAKASQGMARNMSGMMQRQHTLGQHVSVQRDATGPGIDAAAPSMVRDVISSPGRPLDASTRAAMEPRFGHDFSNVRVHSDDRAAASARAVNANAYTAGNHVAFGAGKYAPETQGGQRLMAHELAHVVQQSSGPVGGEQVADGLSVSHPSDRFEQAASHTAAVGSTPEQSHSDTLRSAVPARRGSLTVQRQTDTVADDAAKKSANAGVASAIGGGFSALFAGIGLIPAFESAGAAKTQAAEAVKQTELNKQSLEVAKEALAVSENPPVPAPLTGGIVVNNNSGYADIPTTTAPKSSTVKGGDEGEKPVTLLKVSQGANDFATFNAVIKSNGRDITGGYLQDGPAQGYSGGSAAGNVNLNLKPVPASPPPLTGKKGEKDTRVAGVKFLISGNNIAPRTKTGSTIQRFSGSVGISASGLVVVSEPFTASPGTVTKGQAGGPAVTIDLPPTSPAASAAPAATPAPAPQKAGGGTPPK